MPGVDTGFDLASNSAKSSAKMFNERKLTLALAKLSVKEIDQSKDSASLFFTSDTNAISYPNFLLTQSNYVSHP